MKILLVEDDVLIGLDFKSMLLDLGCEVAGPMLTVATALEAIRTEVPDGALLDFSLRDETSVPVAEALKKASCPFCFITGYSEPPDLPLALRDVPRVLKPVTKRDIGEAVEKFSPGSRGRRNSTVLKGVFAPPIPLDNRLARATGSRQRGFLISPIPRESEATEGRGRQEIPELLRTQRKVEVRFSDVRDLPGFPPGFSNRGSCGGGC